jgi:hypothetical protein
MAAAIEAVADIRTSPLSLSRCPRLDDGKWELRRWPEIMEGCCGDDGSYIL